MNLPPSTKTFQVCNFIHGTFHSTWKLRIHDKFALARTFESCSSDCFTQSIFSFASIFTRVLWIDRRNFKDDKSKITECSNSWTSLQSLAIPIPIKCLKRFSLLQCLLLMPLHILFSVFQKVYFFGSFCTISTIQTGFSRVIMIY